MAMPGRARTTYGNAATGPAGSALGAGYPGTVGNHMTVRDYGAMVEPFFGPPSKPIADNTDSRYPHEAFFLQDAYNGRNDYIRQTIVYAVVNQNSFMTKYILPWRNQDNPNIAWEKVQFNRTLMDLEPEQGVPRYVTVEKEAHSDKMVRRGLALIVNHGFAATPGGQNDWAWKMATIAGAMQETCDQDGLLTLLGCKDTYKALRTPLVYGAAEKAASKTRQEDRELFQFGIVQREDRGWISLDAEAEYEMRLQHVQPDSWIVPPRMLNFVALGQPAETEYYRAGEEARANLRRGGDNFATFRGKKVFETKPYNLDVDGRALDPLTRERMIGDYFVELPDEGTTEFYCCQTDKFQSRKGAEEPPQGDEPFAVPGDVMTNVQQMLENITKDLSLQEERISDLDWAADTQAAEIMKLFNLSRDSTADMAVGFADLQAQVQASLEKSDLFLKYKIAAGDKEKVVHRVFAECLKLQGDGQFFQLLAPLLNAPLLALAYVRNWVAYNSFGSHTMQPGKMIVAACPYHLSTFGLNKLFKIADLEVRQYGASMTDTDLHLDLIGVPDAEPKVTVEQMLWFHHWTAAFVLTNAGDDATDEVTDEVALRDGLVAYFKDNMQRQNPFEPAQVRFTDLQTIADSCILNLFLLRTRLLQPQDTPVPKSTSYGVPYECIMHQLVATQKLVMAMTPKEVGDDVLWFESRQCADWRTDTFNAAARVKDLIMKSVTGAKITRDNLKLTSVQAACLCVFTGFEDDQFMRADLTPDCVIQAILSVYDTENVLGPGVNNLDNNAVPPPTRTQLEAMSVAELEGARKQSSEYCTMARTLMDTLNGPMREVNLDFGPEVTRGMAKTGIEVGQFGAVGADIGPGAPACVKEKPWGNDIGVHDVNQLYLDCFRFGSAAGVLDTDYAWAQLMGDTGTVIQANQATKYIENHARLPAHDAVRTAVADALVESSGSVAPLKSWARELSASKLSAFATQPAAEHLLIDRLSTAFRAKHAELAMHTTADEQPCQSEAEKLASMKGSVMCKIGGPASPFEQTRRKVMEGVALDLTTAIKKAEAEHQTAIQKKETNADVEVAVALCKEAIHRDVIAPLRPVNMPGGGRPYGGAGVGTRTRAILCFRPFRRYQMGTGILCQSGEALGNTFRGHEDFQMTDNIIAKTHIGHYTMWHKAVVVDDRRLYLAEDMFCSGYGGGECNNGCKFPQNRLHRSAFKEDPVAWMETRGASILFLRVTLKSVSCLPRSFDLCNLVNEFATYDIQIDETPEVPVGQEEFSTRRAADEMHTDLFVPWIEDAFQSMNSAYDMEAEGNYLSAGGTVNALCFRTMEVAVDKVGHRHIRTLNQGHFGVNGCYEGARRPRSGFIETFKDCKYEQTYLSRGAPH